MCVDHDDFQCVLVYDRRVPLLRVGPVPKRAAQCVPSGDIQDPNGLWLISTGPLDQPGVAPVQYLSILNYNMHVQTLC